MADITKELILVKDLPFTNAFLVRETYLRSSIFDQEAKNIDYHAKFTKFAFILGRFVILK
jgi:hypothetical protein